MPKDSLLTRKNEEEDKQLPGSTLAGELAALEVVLDGERLPQAYDARIPPLGKSIDIKTAECEF